MTTPEETIVEQEILRILSEKGEMSISDLDAEVAKSNYEYKYLFKYVLTELLRCGQVELTMNRMLKCRKDRQRNE